MDPIREEVFGSKGLAKIHRDKHFPDTDGMARIAQTLFSEKLGSPLNMNVDDALDNLLVFEFSEFNKRQTAWMSSFLDTLSELPEDMFPECRKVFDQYVEISRVDPIEAMNNSGITRLMSAFFDSQAQSRKTRAGTCLEKHVEYLLIQHGLPNFETQKKLTTGSKNVKVDFIFPSIGHYNEHPLDCIACACQTTSNDRFRLSVAQLDKGLRKYILTGIGCSNFADTLQSDSLTSDKLSEISDAGIKYVVLEKGIDSRLSSHPAVISYSEFFTEVSRLSPIWD